MRPLEAIRKHCVDCVGGNVRDVRDCGGDHCLQEGGHVDGVCLFYAHRNGSGRPSVKLIRKYCLFCMGNNDKLVRECHEKECSLHPFRMGRNPNIQISDEQREKLVARFKKYDEKSEMAGA